MTAIKRMVCLANPRKLVGRCIAGREWLSGKGGGGWIRPVSARRGQEVSEHERQHEDGSDPRALDSVDVPVKGPRPDGCQTENWLLDPERCWERAGSCSPFELPDLADLVEPLWMDGHSACHGLNDTIPLKAEGEISSSLRLVGVEELALEVFAPGEAFGNSKRRVQGRFVHAGRGYAFRVTDPVCERRYLSRLDGKHRIGERHLTIALGEPYEGAIHKFIAAIIEPDGQR